MAKVTAATPQATQQLESLVSQFAPEQRQAARELVAKLLPSETSQDTVVTDTEIVDARYALIKVPVDRRLAELRRHVDETHDIRMQTYNAVKNLVGGNAAAAQQAYQAIYLARNELIRPAHVEEPRMNTPELFDAFSALYSTFKKTDPQHALARAMKVLAEAARHAVEPDHNCYQFKMPPSQMDRFLEVVARHTDTKSIDDAYRQRQEALAPKPKPDTSEPKTQPKLRRLRDE
jgi:hypothetical protein